MCAGSGGAPARHRSSPCPGPGTVLWRSADTAAGGADLDRQGVHHTNTLGTGMRHPSHTTFDLLTLSLAPGLAPRTIVAIHKRSEVKSVLNDPDGVDTDLSAEARRMLSSGECRRRAEHELKRCEGLGVQL